MIGAELELGHAVPAGWADEVSKDRLDDWREDGMELKQEVEETLMDAFNAVYWPLMRKVSIGDVNRPVIDKNMQRLALRRELDSDPDHLIRPLLRLLEAHQLDFHSTFRTLSSFQPSLSATELELFAARLTPESVITSRDGRERAQKEWVDWLKAFKQRIELEQVDWDEHENWTLVRVQEGRKANPRFVLRQWVLEEVIEKMEKDHVGGKRILAKVLEVCDKYVLFELS